MFKDKKFKVFEGMLRRVEMFGHRETRKVITDAFFVVVKSESETCFSFPYIIAMGTFCAKKKINNIRRVTIEDRGQRVKLQPGSRTVVSIFIW